MCNLHHSVQLTYLIRKLWLRSCRLRTLSKRAIKELMDEVTSDLTGLLYQTELIIVPFTNPLIRPESLSCAGALLGKQTRRQSGSLTFWNFQSNGKLFQSDLSLADEPPLIGLNSLALQSKYFQVSINSTLLLNLRLEIICYTAGYMAAYRKYN